MSKDPAFLFYPNDYIGGTMGMTFEEKGAYIELLMLQFNRGHMTSQMIGQTVGQLWVKLQDKFKIDDKGLYYNERLELEIEKRKTFVQSRFNNLNGKNQYSEKRGHKEGHKTDHMENEDEDVNENIIIKSLIVSFENFWDLYDKDIDRIKSEVIWMQLPNEERLECIAKLSEYIKSTPNKKYRRDPDNYLKNKGWRNEIIKSSDKATTFIDSNKQEFNELKKQGYGKSL